MLGGKAFFLKPKKNEFCDSKVFFSGAGKVLGLYDWEGSLW